MKFKIGDQVQIINKNHPQYGDKYEVLDTANSGAFFQLDCDLWIHVDSIELIESVKITESPVTLTIELEKILDKISLAESILDFRWVFKNEILMTSLEIREPLTEKVENWLRKP